MRGKDTEQTHSILARIETVRFLALIAFFVPALDLIKVVKPNFAIVLCYVQVVADNGNPFLMVLW